MERKTKKVLVVGSGCPHCEQVMSILKQRGTLDSYTIVDANTKEGAKIADELGIMAVPECVLVEEKDGKKLVKGCGDGWWMK